MSETDHLEQKIIADANNRAQSVIVDAREQADAILQEARSKIEQQEQEMLARAKKEAKERYEKLIAVGKTEIKIRILTQKQDILDEAFNCALDSIVNLPPDEYIGLLVKLATELIKKGDEEIILSSKDKARIGAQFVDLLNKSVSTRIQKPNITLSDETKEMAGGFILRSGNVEVNYSIGDVLNAKRDEIELEVAKTLFSE